MNILDLRRTKIGGGFVVGAPSIVEHTNTQKPRLAALLSGEIDLVQTYLQNQWRLLLLRIIYMVKNCAFMY